ncbi:MAG: anaerobic ribonucleoside-triphosphate reductase activating protein [Actinomycetota bacterium]|nr:anaerobic ribonucleoside-triphosphate reductase activating protein [Actinomycetota bacterium]
MASLNGGFHIKGMTPISMLDWEGKLATVLFLGGCNLSCPFCQNPELVLQAGDIPDIPLEDVEKYLKEKHSWIDGCVITGGEPTINHGLEFLLSRIKNSGYPIKLDTNGTRPRVLRQLIEKELVDHIAMDVKTSFDNYKLATGNRVSAEDVEESTELLVKSGIEVEFRTTVVPGYAKREDILWIARYLARLNASRYTLQQFKPDRVLDPTIERIKPYPRGFLLSLVEECNEFLPTKIR